MNLETAIDLIRGRGYLNEWVTPADTWWVAHSVPGNLQQDGDVEGTPIPPEVAEDLLISGLLEPLGRDWAWDRQSRVGWFRIRPDDAGSGQQSSR